VAVFIEKTTLEWPQKFGIEVELPRKMVEGENDGARQLGLGESGDAVKVNLLAYLVEKWANIILEETRVEIGRFYPPDPDGWIPVGYIWARTIPCQNPTCGAEIPLVRQFWLAKKSKKKIAYRPVVDFETKQVNFEILEGEEAIAAVGFDPGQGTVTRGDARCPVCGQVTKAADTRRLAKEGKMGERMVAVVLHSPQQTGKCYRLATTEDMRIFQEAAAYLEEKIADWPYLDSPFPEEKMTPNARYMLPTNYGMTQWQELFNARQKLALVTFLEKIKECYARIRADVDDLPLPAEVDSDGLAKAVIGYLGVSLDTLAEHNSSLCRWISQNEAFAYTFGRQALPMMWDYPENNPLSGIGGDWRGLLKWITQYIIVSTLHVTSKNIHSAPICRSCPCSRPML